MPAAPDTTCRRRPALIAKAQSGPGTTISAAATAQNARTELTGTSGCLPRELWLWVRLGENTPKVVPISCRGARMRGRIFPVDSIDRKILAVLQREGRLTLTELADRVQLSLSPCHRRLRALERNGTIQGYRAVVDPVALGLTFEALSSSPCDKRTGKRCWGSRK